VEKEQFNIPDIFLLNCLTYLLLHLCGGRPAAEDRKPDILSQVNILFTDSFSKTQKELCLNQDIYAGTITFLRGG
jgi:hypothetical protein